MYVFLCNFILFVNLVGNVYSFKKFPPIWSFCSIDLNLKFFFIIFANSKIIVKTK